MFKGLLMCAKSRVFYPNIQSYDLIKEESKKAKSTHLLSDPSEFQYPTNGSNFYFFWIGQLITRAHLFALLHHSSIKRGRIIILVTLTETKVPQRQKSVDALGCYLVPYVLKIYLFIYCNFIYQHSPGHYMQLTIQLKAALPVHRR